MNQLPTQIKDIQHELYGLLARKPICRRMQTIAGLTITKPINLTKSNLMSPYQSGWNDAALVAGQ